MSPTFVCWVRCKFSDKKRRRESKKAAILTYRSLTLSFSRLNRSLLCLAGTSDAQPHRMFLIVHRTLHTPMAVSPPQNTGVRPHDGLIGLSSTTEPTVLCGPEGAIPMQYCRAPCNYTIKDLAADFHNECSFETEATQRMSSHSIAKKGTAVLDIVDIVEDAPRDARTA